MCKKQFNAFAVFVESVPKDSPSRRREVDGVKKDKERKWVLRAFSDDLGAGGCFWVNR